MTNQAAETASMQSEGRGRWIGLAMLSVGVAMIIVDATIVNVAIPSIISDLDLDSTAGRVGQHDLRPRLRRPPRSRSAGSATSSAGVACT
jgi:hypothetical protein